MMKCFALCCMLAVATLCPHAHAYLGDDMAKTIQACCTEGHQVARQGGREECRGDLPPSADVPPQFASMCAMAKAQCCTEYFQKKNDCDNGNNIFFASENCDSTKGIQQSCCDSCARGTATGASSGPTACQKSPGGSSAEELLAHDAFVTCCGKGARTWKPNARTEQKNSNDVSLSTLPSTCEEYAPNELCAHHCIPVPGSYRCECNPGFMLMADGRNCKEVTKNRCKPRNHCQHKCNDNGVEVKCSCRRGYELMPDGKSCQDIDECQLDVPVCLPGTTCHNIQGSYRCLPGKKETTRACPPGFTRNAQNNACDDINECLLPKPPCPSYICENTIGGYSCGGVVGTPEHVAGGSHAVEEDQCPPGFQIGLNGECEDVDECATQKHDCNLLSQFCINTHKSFYCQDKVSRHCPPGFKIDLRTNKCEDINECENDGDICRPDQVCVNQLGQYDCKLKVDPTRTTSTCPEGMRKKEGSVYCEDIDECAEGTHMCDLNQNCLNTNGSYDCHCKLGYELDITTGACIDLNECATGQHECLPQVQRCDNTVGSYLCVRIASCGTGYVLQHSTGKCEDIDECALGTHNCGSDYTCFNVRGSFRCVRRRTSTTSTTTPLPEYEYEYYDSDEETDNNTVIGKEKEPSTTTTSTTQIPEHKQTALESPDNHGYYSEPKTTNSSNYPLFIPEPPKLPPKPRVPEPHPQPLPTEPQPRPTESQPRPTEPQFRPTEPQSRPNEPQPRPTEPQTRPTESQPRPSEPQTRRTEPQPRPTEPQPRPTEPQPRPTEPQPRLTEPEPVPQPRPNQEHEIKPTQWMPYQPQQPEYHVTEEAHPTRNPAIIPPEIPPEELPKVPEQQPSPPYYNQEGINEALPTEPHNKPEGVHSPVLPPEGASPTPPHVVDVNVGENTAIVVGERKADGSLVIDTKEIPKNEWTEISNKPKDCPFGFEPDEYGSCFDIDECATNRHSCSGLTEVCKNTIGGYTCNCAAGFRRDLVTKACDVITTSSSTTTTTTTLPPPTTSSSFWGYPVNHVTQRPFRPRNLCDAGFHYNPKTYICEDINECTNGQANCAAVEICINTEGGYKCECPPNWRLDDVRHRCVPNSHYGQHIPPGYGNEPGTVFPTVPPKVHVSSPTDTKYDPEITQIEDRGSVFRCPAGYRLGDDNTCIDVNECLTGEAKCGPLQICSNLPGGYSCNCPTGHRLIGDHECEDVDECAVAGSLPVCSQNADCVNTIGSYKCQCHTGFRSAPVNDKVCVDVDECMAARPGTLCQHRCNNVWGGYRCTCHRGYRLMADNSTCADIDECSEFKSKVPCVGRCLNEPGSYRCACPKGYKLSADERSCIDIDECETGEAPCAKSISSMTSHDACVNTRGSFRCHRITCPPGYRLQNKHRCSKVDLVCQPGDWNCTRQPTTISYNFITFVSNLYIPDAQLKLFTMKGPAWSNAKMRFELRLVNVNAPPSVRKKADINDFLLTQKTNFEGLMSLVRPLEGPQSIELEMSMDVYTDEQFGGTAVAKLFIYVSEYEF